MAFRSKHICQAMFEVKVHRQFMQYLFTLLSLANASPPQLVESLHRLHFLHPLVAAKTNCNKIGKRILNNEIVYPSSQLERTKQLRGPLLPESSSLSTQRDCTPGPDDDHDPFDHLRPQKHIRSKEATNRNKGHRY